MMLSSFYQKDRTHTLTLRLLKSMFNPKYLVSKSCMLHISKMILKNGCGDLRCMFYHQKKGKKSFHIKRIIKYFRQYIYIYIHIYQDKCIYKFTWNAHLKLNQGIQLNSIIRTFNYISLFNNYFLKVCNRKLSKVIHIGRFPICLFQFSSRLWLHLKWIFSLLLCLRIKF